MSVFFTGTVVRHYIDTHGKVMQMSNEALISFFKDKSVALIGAGVSNMPLIGFITSLGGHVTLREKNTEDKLGDRASRACEAGAKLVLGEAYLDGMTEDIIIRSPGIRPDIPQFAEAAARGACVVCEAELFAQFSPCSVYAVTGSDGKSTTTTVLSKLLMPRGRVYLGGNIGEPLFHRVCEMSTYDAAAVELSSFQLMTMNAHFDSAIITNITPNHLNWHTGMDEYILAKQNILKNTGRAVLNFDDDVTRCIGERLIADGTCRVTYFSLSPISGNDARGAERVLFLEDGDVVCRDESGTAYIMSASDIVLPGRHNIANYMAAAGAAWDATSIERIHSVATTFGGVKHRLQLIAEKCGVRYYNSSIDSSPTRTAAAISALRDSTPERRVVIICGGYDKNIPFEPLADTLLKSENIKSVVLTGATSEKILTAIRSSADFREEFDIHTVPEFDEAVRTAAHIADSGDSVLLSPACASFDAFPNFEVRGERFAAVVSEL